MIEIRRNHEQDGSTTEEVHVDGKLLFSYNMENTVVYQSKTNTEIQAILDEVNSFVLDYKWDLAQTVLKMKPSIDPLLISILPTTKVTPREIGLIQDGFAFMHPAWCLDCVTEKVVRIEHANIPVIVGQELYNYE
jgi:hypothetical protein